MSAKLKLVLSCLEGQFSAGNDGEAGCCAARRQAGN